MHVITEIVNNCHFKDGGPYRPGPYCKSIEWCANGERESIRALMNHMQIQTEMEHMDASFGAEFGSCVRLIYLPPIHMINPTFTLPSEEMIECVDRFGDNVISAIRHKDITVSYLNKEFQRENKVVSGKDACLLQAVMDQL